jgi:phospholipase C
VDEHPDSNIQTGAAETQKIINAFLNSPAWKDSVFILTFDEGGGVYDHVPPFNEVEPDNIPPNLQSGDAQAQFNQSGFRIPLVIISPWSKPHYVSHTYRDSTAILNLIESRFGVPALTARDAAQADMSEFFDFTVPGGASLNPPPGCGTSWATCLPSQLTNGAANMNLETFP